jgi:hypothetical protein
VAVDAGLVLGERNAMAASGKKRHQGNGKKDKSKKDKDEGKDKSKARSPPCSGGACEAVWTSDSHYDAHNRNYCEQMCRQCDGGTLRRFCIVEVDPADPTKVAVCCNEFAECCGEMCCGSCGHHCDPGSRCEAPGVCLRICGDTTATCAGCEKCICEEAEGCGLTSGCGHGYECCGTGYAAFSQRTTLGCP